MSEPLVLEFADAPAAFATTAGGKGSSLARLTQGGFDVPPGVIVPAHAYREFMAGSAAARQRIAMLDFSSDAALHAGCAAVREALLAHPLPESLQAALRVRLPALLQAGPVSVRSSATLEDGAGAAFAGQHDTYLNVHTLDEVLKALRRCYASLWEDRAVRYRHMQGIGLEAADMAVVIQAMVQSEVAGVAFSLHPVTGDLDQIMVNAAWGLGETVVSGEGDVDQWLLSKSEDVVLERTIARKARAIVGTTAGTAHVDVPGPRALEPSLSDAQLSTLRALVLRVERFHGFPQDVEWAIAGGRLFLLQARPVTRFPARWTRDESAERFPNPITPLTWDFTTPGFHESLAHSLALMEFPPFDGMWFERFDGFIYGNQTAVQLFTAGQRVRFDSIEELEQRQHSLLERYRWVQELPVQWARDLDRYLLGLGRLRSVRLEELDDRGLWDHILAVDALGRSYFLPNIAISISHRLLHRSLFRLLVMLVGPQRAPQMHDALTCFCDTKTNLVNADLYRLQRMIRADAALGALLAGTDRRQIWEQRLLDGFPRFAAAFAQFLENHGHREVDFDAYHPTWSGQPWTVLENLRLMAARDGEHDPAAREVELRQRQSQAEREFLAIVPGGLRDFASELLRLTRAYTGLDDLEHYQTTRLMVPFRAAVVALGSRLVSRGILPVAGDIFFLRRATLRGLVEGTVDEAAATAEARANRDAWERQCRTTPPRVHGEEATPPGEGALRGLPGSPGVAEGPVCCIHSVEDFPRFKPGAVLVARTTNPAWTPLFYSASAVITESGGPLSHGAVTAREVGIPAIMAVHGALGTLRDGDFIRVNGTQGIASRLGEATC